MESSKRDSALMALNVGTVVGGYRIESVLGHGSMGTVYSALDVSLERRVALKILIPELARDERFRERFFRESKLAASLEHPHIVPIHAAGEVDGVLYLAMRYVDGRDLSGLLESLGRLDPERAVRILGQIAGALDAAHTRGLVHRDVKPANILLARHAADDYAYLCDFGLAKHASTVSSLTGSRAIVGTVDYLSPEQIAGGVADGRVDVYALGCVLYECVTGEPPFRRENDLAALLAHANDPVPRPSERRAELPEALDDVIARALAKDREDRFATCGELIDTTQAVLRGEAPVLPAPRTAPTAAVRTFLFADVRGYTSYTREHGDEAGAALARRFAAIVEALAPAHSGKLQELRGDEALVVFDSARAALRFALALQAKVAEDELPRKVGVGLDAGEAVPVEEGFRGGALNRAARLCALAKPGQVLASDGVRELAGTTDGVAYGFRRVERVKGFEKPVGVVEIHQSAAAPGRELGRRARRIALGTRPRHRLALAGVALAVLAVAAVGLARLIADPDAPPAAKSVAVLGAANGEVETSIDAGGEFQQIVTGDGVLYGIDLDGGLITSIDPGSVAITGRRAALGLYPSQVAPAVAHGSIWVADSTGPRLLRIDPRTPNAPIHIALPNSSASEDPQHAHGVAVTKDGIWAVYGNPQRIARVDPATSRVVLSRKLEGAETFGVGSLLASDDNVLWAVQRDAKRVWRLDPVSGDTLTTGAIGDDVVEDAAVEAGYLWVASETAAGVWKVDARGTTVGKVATGALPWAVVRGGGALWVPNANDGTVTRIDPETDETTTFDVGHRPLGTALVDGRVWVSLGLSAEDAQSRIAGSRVLTAAVIGDPIPTTDPGGSGASADTLALADATGARLMVYRVQPDGSGRIVPEIAAGPPVVSGDGLTYTFRVRKGFAFSPPSTEEVTAESIRYSIERAGEQDEYCAYVFSVVKKIEAGGSRIVFTLNSATGDLVGRVAHPCASVVPIGTPIVSGGVSQPIPSAGPYYPDTQVFGQQIVLLRNPNYGGARPQKLDAIVLGLGYAAEDAVQAVVGGESDLVTGGDPLTGGALSPPTGALAPGGTLATKYGTSAGVGQRYFRSPTTTTRNVVLNYARGPLRDVRLRRAVSLALDRAAMAEVWGATPYATMIPPGVPGSVESPGRGARPSLARARALVAGRAVTLDLVIRPDLPEAARVAELIRQSLARVGIEVVVRTHPEIPTLAGDPAEGIDLMTLGWFMDYADPANAVTGALVELPNFWGVPQAPRPAWLTAALAAQRVTGPARAATFRALDRRISRVDVPLAVTMSQLGRPVFVSERVGCLRLLPLYSGLPDVASLCLKQ
jgi:ABC-type transport system substrate-binding protein/class 3 adenylate cyclase/tRNA A-37 threonylcarbamoyl transferase component Bud32/DNA-binding beta-propeller fold protein YncE